MTKLLNLVVALLCLCAPVFGQDGWTQFTASQDSRLVYVSISGNDANSGLSTTAPKRTIAAGASLIRDGYPDWLLLKSGETWNEVFPEWKKGGRSATERMVVSVYGGTQRATVLCGTSQGFGGLIIGATPKSHLAVTSIAFIADTNTGTSTTAGVEFLGSWTDVLLEDVMIARFHTNLVFQSDRTQQLMRDISVRRCVIVDAFTTFGSHAEGCYIAGVDRLLLEECVFDHNGWNEQVPGANRDIFRHNIYIQGHGGNYDDCTNVTTRGIIAARAAATGFQQRPGGVCEGHLLLDSALIFGTDGGTVSNCVAIGASDVDAGNPWGIAYNPVQATPGASTRFVNCLAIGPVAGTGNIYAFAADTITSWSLDRCVVRGWKHGTQGVPINAANAPQPTITNCNLEQTPPDYPVSVEAYMAMLGRAPSLPAYMAECRLQSRANWRGEFTAAAFNEWARAAFGMGCYADRDGDGVLSFADFGAFLQQYAAGDPSTNCDHSVQPPILNVGDFTCYLQRFAAGCP